MVTVWLTHTKDHQGICPTPGVGVEKPLGAPPGNQKGSTIKPWFKHSPPHRSTAICREQKLKLLPKGTQALNVYPAKISSLYQANPLDKKHTEKV